MSAAQLRSAARAGDAQEVARLLDGQFKGTHTSRRLESLAVCIRQLLREHEHRHAAEPESVPRFMTLEVLEDEYRRANTQQSKELIVAGNILNFFCKKLGIDKEKGKEMLEELEKQKKSGGGSYFSSMFK